MYHLPCFLLLLGSKLVDAAPTLQNHGLLSQSTVRASVSSSSIAAGDETGAGPASTAAAAVEAAEAAIIQTTSGKVRAHKSSWPPGSNVDEFLGVPYAQAPVGKLRFMAPEQYRGSDQGDSSVVFGDKPMDACLQPVQGSDALLPTAGDTIASYGYGMGARPGRKYSEDCLSVNIWSKPSGNSSDAAGTAPKAVLVWVHGGAFATGDPTAPFFNGARLAELEDVIVVTVGYRLGFWANPGAPGLKDQNLGIRDIRMAVEWLRDNIDKFGGDAKRMSLFGESSGAVFVDYYAYAYPKDPIVAGLISQSGSSFIGIGYPKVSPLWFSISSALGCGGLETASTNTSTTTLDCMRNIPASLILSAGFGATATGYLMQFGAFGPIVDNVLVFDNYRARASARMFAQVPYLAGHTEREAGLISALPFGLIKALSQQRDNRYASLFSMLTSTLEVARNSYLVAGIGALLGPLLEGSVGCATRDAVEARRKAGVPTWRYLFSGSYGGSELYPDTGAYHSIDIPAVFGTNGNTPLRNTNNEQQERFVRSMMHTWAGFAKDPQKGLNGLGWRPYDRDSTSLNRLGYNGKAEITYLSNAQYDNICPTVARVGSMTGISSGT